MEKKYQPTKNSFTFVDQIPNKKEKKKMHFIFTIITKQHICSSTTPSLGESTFFDQQLVLVLKIEPTSERGAALTEKLTVPLMIITFIIFRQKTL